MSYSRKTLAAFSAALEALYAAPPAEGLASKFPSIDGPLSEDEAYLVCLFSDHVTTRLNRHGREAADASPEDRDPGEFLRLRARGLTLRECEVLSWIAQGKRDAEIATILRITTKTVGKHVEHILEKLGVETRTAAACAVQEWLPQNG